MNNGGLPHENRKYKESTISKWKAYQMSLTADLKLSKKKKKVCGLEDRIIEIIQSKE